MLLDVKHVAVLVVFVNLRVPKVNHRGARLPADSRGRRGPGAGVRFVVFRVCVAGLCQYRLFRRWRRRSTQLRVAAEMRVRGSAWTRSCVKKLVSFE